MLLLFRRTTYNSAVFRNSNDCILVCHVVSDHSDDRRPSRRQVLNNHRNLLRCRCYTWNSGRRIYTTRYDAMSRVQLLIDNDDTTHLADYSRVGQAQDCTGEHTVRVLCLTEPVLSYKSSAAPIPDAEQQLQKLKPIRCQAREKFNKFRCRLGFVPDLLLLKPVTIPKRSDPIRLKRKSSPNEGLQCSPKIQQKSSTFNPHDE